MHVSYYIYGLFFRELLLDVVGIVVTEIPARSSPGTVDSQEGKQ